VTTPDPPGHAVCPKCRQRNTVKATETWEKEIHFCVDCGETFAVKKPQELSGSQK
jgi:Zn ribbon nucleic-acid-binding protein